MGWGRRVFAQTCPHTNVTAHKRGLAWLVASRMVFRAQGESPAPSRLCAVTSVCGHVCVRSRLRKHTTTPPHPTPRGGRKVLPPTVHKENL